MQRKLITWLLVLVMLIGVLPFGSLAAGFQDVKSGAYYYDAVQWAVKEGITNGTSATAFSPDATCTRAQIVTFLWRAKGEPEPSSAKNPFQDVKSDAYYYKAVIWAVEQGITQGTGKTSFSPSQGCTRGQVATFLWRCAGSEKSAAQNPFQDVSAGAYYHDAVLWAVEHEITKGTGATTFSPNATCTRAQIVTFLFRANIKQNSVYEVSFVSAKKTKNQLASVMVKSGEKLELPDEPVLAEKSDYERFVFGDWCLDEACEQSFDINAPITKDLTLYADWLPMDLEKATVFRDSRLAPLSNNEAKHEIEKSVEEIADEWKDGEGLLDPEAVTASSKAAYAWTSALKKTGLIASSSINYSSYAVSVFFLDGSLSIYSPDIKGTNGSGDNLSVISICVFDEKEEKDRKLSGRAANEQGDILLREVDEVSRLVKFNESVSPITVEQVKTVISGIDKNTRVMFWDGHSVLANLDAGTKLMEGYIVKLKETASDEKDALYREYIDKGQIVHRTNNKYALTEKFFESNMGDANNALFISGACYSWNEYFAQVLFNKGFHTVMLCEKATDSLYARHMMCEIAENLSATDSYGRYCTAEEAYNDAIDVYGFSSPNVVAAAIGFGEKRMHINMKPGAKPFRIVPIEDYAVAKIFLKDADGKAITSSKADITLTAQDGSKLKANYHLLGYWTRIKPGSYQIQIKLDGYPDYNGSISIDEDADIVNFNCQFTDYHALYANIVREREGTWGLGAMQAYSSAMIKDAYQMTGVSVVRLLDMDGDGIEELILGYMPVTFANNGKAAQCEVWTFDGKQAVSLFHGKALEKGQDIQASVTLAKVDGVWMLVDGCVDGPYAPYFNYNLLKLHDGRLTAAHSAQMTQSNTSAGTFKIDGRVVSASEYSSTGDRWLSNTQSSNFLILKNEKSAGEESLKKTAEARKKLGISVDAEALKLVNDRIKAAGDFLYGHFFTMSLTDKNDVIKTDQYPYQYYRVKVADSLEAFRAYARKFYSVNAVDSLIQRTQYCWLEQNGKLYVGPFGSGDAAIVSAEADVYQTSDTQYEVHFLDNSEYGTKSTCSNRLILENGNWVWEKLDWSHFMPFSVTAY